MTAQLRSLDRAFFDLSARVKLRVTGSDRLRFLNGQLTNDIRKATETTALEACVLNAKGKLEANLEARCIDYEKGCYIGQETISRMKMSGQRNKQLCGLVSTKNTPLVSGMRLIGPEGKEIGWITSATRSGQREIALAYVKRGFNSVGSRVEATSAEHPAVSAEVVELPFVR